LLKSQLFSLIDAEDFWAERADKYPILSKLSSIILALPCGSVECERLISLLGLLNLIECIFLNKI
jgi:hypothetical protein